MFVCIKLYIYIKHTPRNRDHRIEIEIIYYVESSYLLGRFLK